MVKIDELIKNLEVDAEWGCRKWLKTYPVVQS